MTKEWSERDSLNFIDPMGDIDQIKSSKDDCCLNTNNHKKVILLYSVITICDQCNQKVEI